MPVPEWLVLIGQSVFHHWRFIWVWLMPIMRFGILRYIAPKFPKCSVDILQPGVLATYIWFWSINTRAVRPCWRAAPMQANPGNRIYPIARHDSPWWYRYKYPEYHYFRCLCFPFLCCYYLFFGFHVFLLSSSICDFPLCSSPFSFPSILAITYILFLYLVPISLFPLTGDSCSSLFSLHVSLVRIGATRISIV